MPGLFVDKSNNNSPSISQKKPKSAGSDGYQESVYNLIPKEYIAQARPPRHRSVYAGMARHEYKQSQVKPAATIGPAEVSKISPKQFLKKHTTEQKKPKVSSPGEPVIKKSQRVDEPLWISHKPKATPFVKPDLHVKPVDRKVIEAYRLKEDYGKTPNYLDSRKKELEQKAAETARLRQLAITNVKRDHIILPEEERLQIVQGLQKNWEKLTSEFQKLPLVIDTVPKINRKLMLERQLKKIEEDLDKFSHQNIVIKL